MNKQELIDKLASLVGSIEDFKGISTFHDGKYAGLEHALELIKQLDEPQKPFVPKFVADYIEEYRGGGATLYEMMDSSEDEVYTWLFGNPRIETENERQLLFAQAYAVGYEVEKEPQYMVPLLTDKEGNKKILVERRESTTSFGIMRMRTTGMSC